MKLHIYIFFCLSLSFTVSRSQDFYRPPVEIGDLFPDSTVIMHFKQPFLILDFWGTWCNACINHLPELDSLQKQFADSLQIVLVSCAPLTADDSVKAHRFIEKYRLRRPDFQLPLISHSSLVWRYGFPVRYLPHYVWLDADRRVIAMTGSEQVTKQAILNLFRGQLPYPMKTDRYDLSPKP